MRRDLISSAIGIVLFTLLCGIAYPLAVEGISQVAFPGNANGQQVRVDGRLVGSKIIGQDFATVLMGADGRPEVRGGSPVTVPDPRYFQARPSATVPPDNDGSTTFSNLGPNSTATLAEIERNIRAYIALNGRYLPGGLTAAEVPVDAADSSASGDDPEISVANADIQAHRIAAVRHLSLAQVHALISRYTLGRGLGFAGEPGVDVLELNLALDRLTGAPAMTGAPAATAGGRRDPRGG